METKILTITKVKSPWYIPGFILTKVFIKSKPEYAALAGLEVKYYHTSDKGSNLGGFYLWKNQSYADAQFTQEWFDRVEKRFKCAGKVEYFSVLDEKSYIKTDFNYDTFRSARCILFKSTESINELSYIYSGLLQAFQLEKDHASYMVLVFKNKHYLKHFIKHKKLSAYETFKFPVLLNNLT